MKNYNNKNIPLFGNKRSSSLKKKKHKWKLNIQKKKILNFSKKIKISVRKLKKINSKKTLQ